MQIQKDQALSGKNNKRLNNVESTNSEGTAAWAEVDEILEDSHVTIPGKKDVLEAKDWVDNGSKL